MTVKYKKFPKDILEEIVKKSESLSEVMRSYGLAPRGANYKRFRTMVRDMGISTEHFLGNRFKKNRNILMVHTKESFTLDVLIKNGKGWHSSGIKDKLIEYGLIENRCSKCNQPPEWFGELLVIQLDHINGDHRDNRLENLRMLCPNCHSQTKTFCKIKKVIGEVGETDKTATL